MDYNLLPFNFKELPSNRYLLANDTNTFSILDNRKELENLVEKKYSLIKKEKIDELLSKNFLYLENELELKSDIYITNNATRIFSVLTKPSLFLIVPTLRCDLDCTYCQVSRVNINKKGYDLDIETIKEIIRVINHVSAESFKIEFQGGEPLLNFNFIKNFVIKIKQEIKNKEISFVLCSNINNISDEILSFCKMHKIFISTSLDGNEKIHNKNRSSRKINSYKTFKSKLEYTRKYLKEEVSALSTVTKETMKDYKSFINAYIDNDFKSISIRPLTQLGFAYNNNTYTAKDFFDFYIKCLNYIYTINDEKNFIEENILIYLSKIFTPLRNGYLDLQSPSAYIQNTLLFNYDGKIFGSDEARMLWEMVKIDELEIGNFKTKKYNFLKNENNMFLANSFIDQMPKCEECTYKNYCGVDIFHHLSTQGDIIADKSISFHCELNTLIFDYIFDTFLSDEKTKRILYKWQNL